MVTCYIQLLVGGPLLLLPLGCEELRELALRALGGRNIIPLYWWFDRYMEYKPLILSGVRASK
jgi:hypothetical protein